MKTAPAHAGDEEAKEKNDSAQETKERAHGRVPKTAEKGGRLAGDDIGDLDERELGPIVAGGVS